MKRHGDDLLLGEWACLGVLAAGPAHGFAVSKRLAPDGDVGRVWSLSRPLTYRAIEQLTERGLVVAVAEEPGLAGGARTVLAVTDEGRRRLDAWLVTPVVHLRDVRSDLLLKLVLAEVCRVPVRALLEQQREIAAGAVAVLADRAVEPGADVVAVWRSESSEAVLRFLDRLLDRLLR